MICESNQPKVQFRFEAQNIGSVVLHGRDKGQHGEQSEKWMKNMTRGQNTTQNVFQMQKQLEVAGRRQQTKSYKNKLLTNEIDIVQILN